MKNPLQKSKKIAFDILLNILASFIPLALLQLALLPSVSKQLGGDRYGLMLAIVALMNTIPGTLGNALNNVRLLKDAEYRSKSLTGDFNLLLMVFSVLTTVAVASSSMYYEGGFTAGVLLSMLLAILWLAREYYIVAFRIKLNYRAILVNNALMAFGYLLGFLLFRYAVPAWQVIYLLGNALSLAYIIRKSTIWREPIRRTDLLRSTAMDTGFITLAGFLGRLTTYADKLLIFPVLGGQAVAIYYAASVFGKMISIGITPVTGVLLTYIARLTNRPQKAFRRMLVLGGMVGVVGFLLIIPISDFLLDRLYPEYAAAAKPLVVFAALDAVIGVLVHLVNPFVLKFNRMKWQLVVNLSTNFLYVLLAWLLSSRFGLLGFCLGLIGAHVFKLLMLLWIYYRNVDEGTLPYEKPIKIEGEQP